MRSAGRWVWATVLLLWATSAWADDAHVDRLARLARVWGTIATFHPWLRYKDIDWDAALVRALPKVKAATSAEEERAALAAMVAEVGDPLTRLNHPGAPPAVSTKPPFTWVDKVLVVDLTARPADPRSLLATLTPEIAKAHAVVFDLRAQWAGENGFALQPVSALAEGLFAYPGRAPSERLIQHRGYRTQGDFGGFSSGTVTNEGDVYLPKPGAKLPRPVFLINARSALPAVVFALQQSGDGYLVSEGPPNEASLVSQTGVALGDGWEMLIRAGELVNADGTTGMIADMVVPSHLGKDVAMDAALRVARNGARRPKRALPPLPASVWRPDRVYHEAELTPELRMLALFRYWTIFHFFYGYPQLLGDWDGVLTRMIPVFEATTDTKSYALALCRLGALTGDAHSSIGGPPMDRLLGNSAPPFAARFVEGKPVVTALRGDAPGVGVGDEIVEVDGEAVGARIARLEPCAAGSNDASRGRNLARILIAGGDGSTASVTLRSADGATHKVELLRKKEYTKVPERGGDIVRVLPGNIGYIDLDRLLAPDVDAALEKVKSTRALIFDMRGYPHGLFWMLAPRMNVKKAQIASRIVTPRLTAFDTQGRDLFLQPIAPTDKWIYQGPSVMLIDERSQSQSEHTGLFLETAAGTKFIGSQTAGANGTVTVMSLPGDVKAWLTGQEIRHADGRQLQKIGLVPDVEVKPTIRGLRAGRDEVLEKAVEFLGGQGALVPARP